MYNVNIWFIINIYMCYTTYHIEILYTLHTQFVAMDLYFYSYTYTYTQIYINMGMDIYVRLL